MRLLDRYLLREFLIPLGYCLGGFLVFWVTYDLFTELNNFQRNHLLLRDVAEYYLVKVPELLVTVIPLGLLLALLYTLTNHARHHELTAMRAAGINLWRLALPYFAVAAVTGLGLFWLNETAVPDGADRADRILARRQSSSSQTSDWQWKRGVNFRAGNRTWYIGAYNPRTSEMLEPHFWWTLPDGSRRKVGAERALRTNESWLFLNAQDVTIPAGSEIPPSPVKHESLLLSDFIETPRLIQSEIKISRLDSIKDARKTHLSIGEIREYLYLHPQLDSQRRDLLRTMMHARMALPWTCPVVVLIALPFGAVSGRRNVFVGVASSVFICFAFYVLRELSQAMGGGGRVAPWLAAWAPNIAFGLAGVIMTQRTR